MLGGLKRGGDEGTKALIGADSPKKIRGKALDLRGVPMSIG